MAIEGVDQEKSPAWWLNRLGKALHERRVSPRWTPQMRDRGKLRPSLELLDDYLRGDPPLPRAASGWQEAMRPFLRLSRMNYALLSVQAVTHRMSPVGFGTAADDDRDGDDEAAKIFKANHLDLKFTETAEWMLGLGDGYMIVGDPASNGGVPPITAEDPRQVITAEDPVTGRTIAALKLFRDDWDAADFAYLYLPGRVYVATRKGGSTLSGRYFRLNPAAWDWDETNGGSEGQVLPSSLGGRVPVVRFQNARGVGEFEPHLDALDRINDGLFERVTIAKMQAFRQRGIEGLAERYPEDHPKAGEKIDYSDAFLADPGALWKLPAGSKIWESTPVDLTPIRLAIKDDVEAFAAVTFTPLHYITPDAAQGSAEGASVMKEGHTFRVEDRTRRSDVGLVDVMSLAFAWMDDKQRANPGALRTLWKSPERYSLAQRGSAATQLKSAGVPQSAIYTDVLGYEPRDVRRLEAERARDLLFIQPPTPPATSTAA